MGTVTCALHFRPAGVREEGQWGTAQTICWNLGLHWQLARKDLRLMQSVIPGILWIEEVVSFRKYNFLKVEYSENFSSCL